MILRQLSARTALRLLQAACENVRNTRTGRKILAPHMQNTMPLARRAPAAAIAETNDLQQFRYEATPALRVPAPALKVDLAHDAVASSVCTLPQKPETAAMEPHSAISGRKRQRVSPAAATSLDTSDYDIRVASIPSVEEAKEAASHAPAGVGPPHWREQFDNIVTMRSTRDAAVDTMGCERCSDETAEPRVQRYQTLVSLLLSSQTKDPITHGATQRLLRHGFTPENIAKTSEEQLASLIYPVGFYKRKASYLKEATDVILKDFGGDIPNTVDKLCSLKGIGPKMAYIAMNVAWGKHVGIGVDTHVHRISNRLGWVKTDTPEKTRECLQSWMPSDLWRDVNILLVGFGQQICQPVRPKCESCLNHNVCPASTCKTKAKALEW
jgi:endonuclease-3